MSKYPIYLNLNGRKTVVIGAGSVGARKAQVLTETGARVVVVALHFDPAFSVIANHPNVEIIQSRYSREYLTGAALVIAATNDSELNRQIYADCRQLEVLCNVVDVPELCDFFVPAVVQRGPLQIAVSTDGNCPAYAGHVRRKLEELFTEAHGRFVEDLEVLRRRLIEVVPDANRRKALLGRLVGDESLDFYIREGVEAWKARANQWIANPDEQGMKQSPLR
jgi:precorrin-2 dehydrogenase / sirohydrochlorin ferrochelatase